MALYDEYLADAADNILRFQDVASLGFVDDDGANPANFTYQDAPTGVAGLVTGSTVAMSLDGTNDAVYGSIPAHLKSQLFSIAIPFQLPGSETDGVIACVQPRSAEPTGGLSGWFLRLVAGKPVLTLNDGASAPFSASAAGPNAVNDSNPHIAHITFDSADDNGRGDGLGTGRLFIDGAQVATVGKASVDYLDRTITAGPQPGALIIGGYHLTALGGQTAQTGLPQMIVDDCAFWGAKALTPTRIAAQAAAAGLVATVRTPLTSRAYLRADTRPRGASRVYLSANTTTAGGSRVYLRADTGRGGSRVFLRARTTLAAGSRVLLRADTATDLGVALRPGVNWRLRLLIGGVDYFHIATGQIRTRWEKEKNFVAFFDLMPPSGVLDPTEFDGKQVVIEYRDLDTNQAVQFARNRYVGTISDAEWLPGRGILRCSATANSDARFRHATPEIVAREVPSEHSPYVFGKSAKGWDLVRDRLETLQADLWLRPDGGLLFAPWQAGAPILEWQDGDYLIEATAHQPARRSEIANRIELRLDYRFARLRQRMIRCHWSEGITWCENRLKPFLLCQRSMIEQAAAGKGGWELIGQVAFQAMPPAKAYPCFPAGQNSAQKYLVWEGDDAQAFARAAWWTIARRWEQDVTNKHTIEVIAQASVDANGLVEQVESYGVQSEKDNSEWLAEKGYSSAGDSFSVVAGGSGASDGGGVVLGDQHKTTDDDGAGNRADFEQAEKTAIAAAVCWIIRAHRHLVSAASLFDPRVKPAITQRLNTAKIQATGRVVAFGDTFDLDTERATTSVDIAPFVVGATGLANASPIEPVTPAELPEESDIPERLYFGTRIGGLTNSPPYVETWTGYTTNYQYDPTDLEPFAANPADPGARLYPNQFAVEYPEIPPQHLQAIELQAAKRIDVVIPDDELVRYQ